VNNKMTYRWDKWFTDENLAKDERILSAPPSKSAEKAVNVFLENEKRSIIDLACGIGRDTFYLEGFGLNIIGVDAAFNGIRVARQVREKKGAVSRLLAADARHLPFKAESFDGIYCFGFLHEFTSNDWKDDVRQVMDEIIRLLRAKGVLVLTVLSGEPGAGLPHVQIYSRQMFEDVTEGLKAIEISSFDDVGCTGRKDYRIWYGVFEK